VAAVGGGIQPGLGDALLDHQRGGIGDSAAAPTLPPRATERNTGPLLIYV
jgi:hypothetical protein